KHGIEVSESLTKRILGRPLDTPAPSFQLLDELAFDWADTVSLAALLSGLRVDCELGASRGPRTPPHSVMNLAARSQPVPGVGRLSARDQRVNCDNFQASSA